MQHVERVRYVAGSYDNLQGLRWVPFGIWFLLIAFGESGFAVPGWVPVWGIYLSYIAGLLLAMVLWALVGLFYYDRKFGNVLGYSPRAEKDRTRPRTERAALIVFGLLCVSVFTVVSPPVWLFGPVLAWPLFVFWRSQRRFGYHHYAVLSVLVLLLGVILGLLSVLDVISVGVLPAGKWWTVNVAMAGVVLVVGGVFDHLLLSRTMRLVPEEDRDRAV